MKSESNNKRWILLIILMSYLMIVLDISIVITGLPKISTDLHFSTASLSWVQNAYTLTFGGVLLLGARAGDILGRKRMFLIVIFSSFQDHLLSLKGQLAHQISAALVGGAIMAALAMTLCWLFIGRKQPTQITKFTDASNKAQA